MHGVGIETSEHVPLPWLVIRQDDDGNRYRVGRYATLPEAQKMVDLLDDRGHRQLYWVEDLGNGRDGPENDGYASRPSPVPDEHGVNIRHEIGQMPHTAEQPYTPSSEEPASSVDGRTDRRMRRARPLFEALAHILPADARERWSEEWMAEWVDLGEEPLRTRVAYLLRVTLRSGLYFAWALRLAARRQRAR